MHIPFVPSLKTPMALDSVSHIRRSFATEAAAGIREITPRARENARERRCLNNGIQLGVQFS
jgi:hypothetical protein